MNDIIYAEEKDGYWRVSSINLTTNEIFRQCILQKKFRFDTLNRIKLTNGDKFIKASQIMFQDGSTWDAASSGFIY